MNASEYMTSFFSSLFKDLTVEDFFQEDAKLAYNVSAKNNPFFQEKTGLPVIREHIAMIKYVYGIIYKNYHISIKRIIGDQSVIVVEWTLRAELINGESVKYDTLSIFDIKQGKIEKEVQYWEDCNIVNNIVHKLNKENEIYSGLKNLGGQLK
jgi:hypothetical protein